jgi:hypothetical protein
MAGSPDLAEGERVGLDAGVEERDLEGVLGVRRAIPRSRYCASS